VTSYNEEQGEVYGHDSIAACERADARIAELEAEVDKWYDAWVEATAEAEREREGRVGADHHVEEAEAECKGYREALKRAKAELGVPGPDYPAPVANAVKIIDQALSGGEQDG
jgi:hypothetical protein